ncbi:hypothetical protein E2C01_091216 [Portunus trituberculatus]|uniref:Uncharacterized protein n=1 Tax=Portunus trituberculatus TaxID=210409 RepID=A0A5B7JNF4_PORTR|nr:hypothetical protein [Portunus trituberculatus]
MFKGNHLNPEGSHIAKEVRSTTRDSKPSELDKELLAKKLAGLEDGCRAQAAKLPPNTNRLNFLTSKTPQPPEH